MRLYNCNYIFQKLNEIEKYTGQFFSLTSFTNTERAKREKVHESEETLMDKVKIFSAITL